MTLKASVNIMTGAKVHYLRTLQHGEDLCGFEHLCGKIGNSTTRYLNCIILGLGT